LDQAQENVEGVEDMVRTLANTDWVYAGSVSERLQRR